MKIKPVVWKETAHILFGVLIGSAGMIFVFRQLGRLDSTVLLGTLLGVFCSVFNFWLMSISVQHAVQKPEQAQFILNRSHTHRMRLIAITIFVGFAAPCFHVVAVSIPFLLPRITILVMQKLGLYQPQTKGGEKNNGCTDSRRSDLL